MQIGILYAMKKEAEGLLRLRGAPEAEWMAGMPCFRLSRSTVVCVGGVGKVNAAMAANAHEFIMSLPEGYHTDIGQRGVKLSGGQKQRCACARAIINQPKLILADEPTGALDSHSSQMLLSAIQSINETLGATILMVTHDAFSASYANRILFLRDGTIFTEIFKGSNSRRTFFEKILDVLTMTGGGVSDVC